MSLIDLILVSKVLSGQRAGKNYGYKCSIHLWSLDNLDTISVLELGQNESGILSVAFSNNPPDDSILLVAVVQDAKSNYLSVYDYSNKTKKFQQQAQVSTGSTDYSGCAFHPLDNHLVRF